MPKRDLVVDVRALLGGLDSLQQLVATVRAHAEALRVLRMRLHVQRKLIDHQTTLISAQNRTIARQSDQIMHLRADLEQLWDVHGNAMCALNEVAHHADDLERNHRDLAQLSGARIGDLADRCDHYDHVLAVLEDRLNTRHVHAILEELKRSGLRVS